MSKFKKAVLDLPTFLVFAVVFVLAAFCGVMRAAGRRWSCGPDLSVEAARSFADSYVEHLAPALGRDWGVQPRVPSPASPAGPPKEHMPRPAG